MGAKARLSRDELVSTALALADAEGLDAVTTRRVAQHHGATPMALYRHFRDKEAILDALAERLLSLVTVPDPDSRPWHEQLQEVLDALLPALREHPEVAGLVMTRILASEPGLALTERTLALLAEGGFPVDEAAEIASQVLCALVTLAISEPGRTDADRAAQDAHVEAKRAALATLSPTRYPYLVAAADSLAGCASHDLYYTRGSARIIAGIRAGARTR
ncbi:TetR/AcrR family transcriptional regulator [Streptomyces polygonati]|uniref:TetR/AcrR family transcriptional regulator n=1 Tax=Streptomyces polygonati TaxID=1617087 RepID=A0ABV8HJ23_9ACTN